MGRMTARTVLALLASSLWFAAPGLAQESRDSRNEEEFRPRVEFTPFAAYRVGGEFDFESDVGVTQTLEVGDDSSWGFDVGLYRDRYSFYELLYSQQNAQLQTNGTTLGSFQLRTEYVHLGGTLLFPQENWLVPYLSMTVGVTKLDPQDDQYASESEFSMSLGGGLRLPFNEHLAVVMGVRGYLTFVDSSTQIFCVSAGGAACAFRISADSFFQAEAQIGFALTF